MQGYTGTQPVQYPQQPVTMYQQPYQQPYQQQVVVIQTTSNNLSFTDIYLSCKPPQMLKCQGCCGCYTCWTSGAGLWCGSCCGCYDKSKPDCQDVFLAGCVMEWTAEFCIGCVSACIVGWRMMCGN